MYSSSFFAPQTTDRTSHCFIILTHSQCTDEHTQVLLLYLLVPHLKSAVLALAPSKLTEPCSQSSTPVLNQTFAGFPASTLFRQMFLSPNLPRTLLSGLLEAPTRSTPREKVEQGMTGPKQGIHRISLPLSVFWLQRNSPS